MREQVGRGRTAHLENPQNKTPKKLAKLRYGNCGVCWGFRTEKGRVTEKLQKVGLGQNEG